MLTYQINSVRYSPKAWVFPAGEAGIRILPFSSSESFKIPTVTINASIQSSLEVMQLFMLTDALRRQFPVAKIRLALGYTPYGRQDRVCNPGDSLSIAVFAKLINSHNYEVVQLFDPHSDVTPALFNNVVVYSQECIFTRIFADKLPLSGLMLVAPDAGAAKKAASIAASSTTFKDVLYAVKSRDMLTGNITSLKLTGNVLGEDCVVIDDLCDGGFTFTQLGSMLREQGAKSLTLIITHGIFTKGTKELTELYDNIYTTNSFHQDRDGLVDGVTYVKLI
jgi:ribose-phosphate pyrophosphokinase